MAGNEVTVYLMRHAEALPVGGEVQRDADRILSPRGEDDSLLVGKALARLDPGVRLILTSPLHRAQQTATLVGQGFKETPSIKASENLEPGFRMKSLLDELLALKTGSVVVIAHMPDVSNFLAYLVADTRQAAIAMHTAAVAKVTLHIAGDRWEPMLHWLLTPDILARLRTNFTGDTP